MFLPEKNRTVGSALAFFEEMGITNTQVSQIFSGFSTPVLNSLSKRNNKVTKTNRMLLELLEQSPEQLSWLLPKKTTCGDVAVFFEKLDKKSILVNSQKLTKGRFAIILGYQQHNSAGYIFGKEHVNRPIQTSSQSVFLLLKRRIEKCKGNINCQQKILEQFFNLSEKVV